MKTVRRNDGTVHRVPDNIAREWVNRGVASYCPKGVWRANLRQRQYQAQRIADRIDGYDRDDLGESPDF